MDAGDGTGAGFWETEAAADVHVAVPDHDGGEPPALRTLSRPPSWHAPSAPASALAALYMSAQRRATEVLRAAVADEELGAAGDDHDDAPEPTP